MSKKKRIPPAKRVIRKTFLELLKKKPFHRITVREICDAADVGRGSFYAHYDDKFMLLSEIENEQIDGLMQFVIKTRFLGLEEFNRQLATNETYPIFTEYFGYVQNNSQVLAILLDRNSGIDFSYKLSQVLTETREETRKCWGLSDQHQNIDSAYRNEILCSIYVSLFSFWLRRGMDISVEEMGHILTLLWKSTAIQLVQK